MKLCAVGMCNAILGNNLNWIFTILVPSATRLKMSLTSFSDHVTKRNGGFGDENGFLHEQNWAVFTDESSYALMRHYVLLAIQTKLKQAKFYYFSFAINSMAKSLQACGKRRETLKF